MIKQIGFGQLSKLREGFLENQPPKKESSFFLLPATPESYGSMGPDKLEFGVAPG